MITNKLPSYNIKHDFQFLKEFVIETKHNVKKLTQHCANEGILIQNIHETIKNCFQISVTEKRTKDDINKLIKSLKVFK